MKRNHWLVGRSPNSLITGFRKFVNSICEKKISRNPMEKKISGGKICVSSPVLGTKFSNEDDDYRLEEEFPNAHFSTTPCFWN